MDCNQEISKNVKNHKRDDNHQKERKNRNKQAEKKKCRKRRRSSSSSDSSMSSRSSSSGPDDGKKRKSQRSHFHTSLSPIDKRMKPEKLPCNPNPSESKNDYQQKVFLFLEQVGYDSDEKENVRRFLLENAPKTDADRTQEKKTNLEELEEAPSPINKPLVRPGSLTVLDKFGNFRLICPIKENERTNVSRSSRSRSACRTSRSRSRDRRNRIDRETYNRPRNGWHNRRRNRERGYRNRSRDRSKTRSYGRRSEESKKGEKYRESKDIKIPDETNLEEMEDFLARVREAKRKKMLEENKDF